MLLLKMLQQFLISQEDVPSICSRTPFCVLSLCPLRSCHGLSLSHLALAILNLFQLFQFAKLSQTSFILFLLVMCDLTWSSENSNVYIYIYIYIFFPQLDYKPTDILSSQHTTQSICVELTYKRKNNCTEMLY